jgi:hypothetical protein
VTRRAGRGLAGVVVLVLIGLVVGMTAASAGADQTPTPAPRNPSAAERPPIVLFAAPGLLWKDVLAMPHLQALAARSSVGELSVKTRGSVTRCGTALLAVSAGNRTSSPDRTCPIDMSTWPLLVQDNLHNSYHARLGTLGSTLQAAGFKTIAVGPDAVPMLANAAGTVDQVTTSVSKALAPGTVSGIVDPRLYGVLNPLRPAAQTAVDRRIAKVERALPSDATFMVAGISDLGGGHPQLHALVLSGPGWTHTELRSSAAGRAPYVQLIDIAPTILAAVGVTIPSVIVGRPMQKSGTGVPSIAAFVDDNHHAVAQRTLGRRAFLTIGIATIIMMLLAAFPGRPNRRVARWLGRLIAPAPVFVFIGNAFPWWRWSSSLSYAAIVFAGCVVLATATTLVLRLNATAGLMLVPVFTFAALAIDQFTGATLQLSAPLGDNPIVAGRFSGMGNLDFSMFATAGLVVAGLAAGRLSRRTAIFVASVVTGATLIVDGAPQLGNDLGGVLSLLPAALILIAMIAQVKISRRRIIMVAVTTIVVAVGLALADYSRPATSQTHVGRFVGQILHGGAGTEVHRKLDASMATFGLTIGTFVVGFALVVGFFTRHRIRAALATVPGATASAVGVGVVAVLGVALNDSGITVGAMAIIVCVTALYGGGLASTAARDGRPGG